MKFAEIRRSSRTIRGLRMLLALLALSTAWRAQACPFCDAVKPTLTQEAEGYAFIALGRLTTPSREGADGLAKAGFVIDEILKSDDPESGLTITPGLAIQAIWYRTTSPGTPFLLRGSVSDESREIDWSTPIELNERSVEYVRELQRLPAAGPQRLQSLVTRLEEADEIVANDAYAEFALAPFADLLPLRDRLPRKFFLQRLEEDKLPDRLRRLYYTLLSVCGEPSDADRLEERLQGEAGGRQGLDALTSCYLSLRGAAGLPLIDRLFLSNPEADSGEQFSVIAALRFQGEEAHFIDRQDLLPSLRLLLASPQNAERIVPDLARWEDWSVRPQVVKLFEESGADASYLRGLLLQYLAACPLPEAAEDFDRLARLDPSAARMARLSISRRQSDAPELGLAPVPPPELDETQPAALPAAGIASDAASPATSTASGPTVRERNERMLWMTVGALLGVAVLTAVSRWGRRKAR